MLLCSLIILNTHLSTITVLLKNPLFYSIPPSIFTSTHQFSSFIMRFLIILHNLIATYIYTSLFCILLLLSQPLLLFFQSLIYSLPCLFFLITLSIHSSHLFIFQPVTSEMDWKTSSGISSTISVPSCPPLPEHPGPSVALSAPSTTQQARPSPYAYTLPAFTRAHPPALPKIFQPSAGTGISQQIFLILYSLLSMVRLFW